ncbi:hypothetical protein ACYZTX_29830 [Pseudomonas sp. MDT1-17]
MADGTADVIDVRSASTCVCDDECDCPAHDSLTFTVNGLNGFGGGDLVMDKGGSVFFACKFLAWEFNASDSYDAADKIKAFFGGFKHIAVRCF